MDLRLVLFSLILTSVNLNLVQGYNCIFKYNEDVSYVCDLTPDEWKNVEHHLSDKTDDDVKRIKFSNRGKVDKSNTINLCERFKNLEEIDFWYFLKIDTNFLKNCKNLRKFYESNSDFLEIPEDFLVNNIKLTSVRLRENNWTTLPERLFANQKEITEILLKNDQIEVLPSKIFKSLESLKSLNLGYNKIKSLDPEWFRDLHNLEMLSFDHNELTDLPKNIFSPLISLFQIDLNGNNLKTIHLDSFGYHPKLKVIKLFNNKINAFDEKILDIKGLETVVIYPNVCTNNFKHTKFNPGYLKHALKKCFENYQPRQEN